MLRWLWTLVMVRSICDGLNVSAWLVLDTRCWQRRGSDWNRLDVNVWLVLDANCWQCRERFWNGLDVSDVFDASCGQHRGSDWDGLDVVGNVMTGVVGGVMTKGADDVMAGMAV